MMNVAELKKQIECVPDDTEIFLRCCVSPTGNIVELKSAAKDSYGFFGKSVDCIIMDPDIDERFIAKKTLDLQGLENPRGEGKNNE